MLIISMTELEKIISLSSIIVIITSFWGLMFVLARDSISLKQPKSWSVVPITIACCLAIIMGIKLGGLIGNMLTIFAFVALISSWIVIIIYFKRNRRF